MGRILKTTTANITANLVSFVDYNILMSKSISGWTGYHIHQIEWNPHSFVDNMTGLF